MIFDFGPKKKKLYLGSLQINITLKIKKLKWQSNPFLARSLSKKKKKNDIKL